MTTVSNVKAKTTVVTGAHTLNSVTVTTAPYSRYSIHDCADPRFAELSNCIWPIGNPSQSGLKVTNGITIHTPDDAAAGDDPLVVTVAYT
jgi:hypothetical protein